MTEQVRRTLGVLCWVIIVIALVVGFFAGYRYHAMRYPQPLGDCVMPDTVTVKATNVSQKDCERICPECLWIVRAAQ